MKAGSVQSRLSRRRLLTLGAFTAPLLAQQSSISRASKGTSPLRITKVEAMVIRTPNDDLPPEALVEMPPVGSMTGGLGLSVWQLLGGKYRDRIPTYTGIGGRSPEELKDNAVKAVESGFGAVKMGLSKGPGTNDLQRVSVIADAIKGKGQLLVDSLGAYKLYEAVKVGRELDRLSNIGWWEDALTPARAPDRSGLGIEWNERELRKVVRSSA